MHSAGPRKSVCEKGQTADSDGPQPSGCINALSLGARRYSPTRGLFPGRHLSSNTESDLDTNVVRTLKQPEGCGPPEFSHRL